MFIGVDDSHSRMIILSGQRLGHLSEAVIERVLGGPITHARMVTPRPANCQAFKRVLDNAASALEDDPWVTGTEGIDDEAGG